MVIGVPSAILSNDHYSKRCKIASICLPEALSRGCRLVRGTRKLGRSLDSPGGYNL